MNATQEQWRPVVGWEGLYEVSDQGRVRSLDRRLPHSHPGHTYLKPGRVLKVTRTAPMGYQAVTLSADNSRKMVRIHTLVLEAFIGPRPEGFYGCHNDGDLNNNRADNLRWDAPSGNSRDTVEHGKHPEASKTHCKNGHPFDEANTYSNPAKPGSRTCRACVREAGRRYNVTRRRRTAIS